METSAELLEKHINRLEQALISLSAMSENAITLLEEAKKALSDAHLPHDDGLELYRPAVYNALAAINSAPCQERPNPQLTNAVFEAKEELRVIREMLLDE